MKQMVRKTAALIAVSLLIFGCETYTEKYAQYEGQQRNWPVSTGATVDTREAVPYYAAPPRPYIVMGDLAASPMETPSAHWLYPRRQKELMQLSSGVPKLLMR